MNTTIGRSIMCRACMKVDGVLLPMYGDDMISKKNLPDKLADLASIKIDKYDGLPTVLCAKCAYRTDSFYDFKLQVQATERKLRKMFQSPNAQDIRLKNEANSSDCDGDNNPNDNALSQSKSNYPSNAVASFINTTEKLETELKVDVKPSLEVNKSDEEVNMTGANEQYEETINYVDDPLSENVGLSTLQNLDQILISDISNMIEETQNELQGTKQEVADGIQEIFQTDNLGYTFLYIPNDEVADIESQNSQQAIHMEEEEDDDENRVYACASNEDPEVEEITEDKDCPNEPVSWSPEDYRNDQESIMEKAFSSANYDQFTTTNARLSATTCQLECHTSHCFNSYTLNGQNYYPSQVQRKTSNARCQNSLYITTDDSLYMEKQKRNFLIPGTCDAVNDATAFHTSASDVSKLASRKNYANGGILETALIPGPTKTEIIPGSAVYIKINELERWTRMYGQKSSKLACRLMRLIVGEENLAGMSVTGRGALQRIPRKAYDAVETYVSSHAMPKMSSEQFQKTMKFLCRTVRKSRELKSIYPSGNKETDKLLNC